MAATCSRAGRPCYVADIDFSDDASLAFRDAFREACSGFKYRDIVAISRACGVCTTTVENWKYGLTFPQKDVFLAQQIINWVESGKPMIQRRPFPATAGMV